MQALSSSLETQRTRVHALQTELTDSRQHAEKINEAIKSAHPLVSSLLLQNSLSTHERQHLCLGLALVLGIKDIPLAHNLATQPSIGKQATSVLIPSFAASASGMSSPGPAWNVSSPRKTSRVNPWLARGTPPAPVFQALQSPREHTRNVRLQRGSEAGSWPVAKQGWHSPTPDMSNEAGPSSPKVKILYAWIFPEYVHQYSWNGNHA